MSHPEAQDSASPRQGPPVWPLAVLLLVVAGGVGAFMVWPTNAAEENTDKADTDKADKKKAAKDKDDRYRVPDGTPKELMAFVQKLLAKGPEKPEDAPKVINAILKASEKVLAAKPSAVDEATLLDAVRAKFGMLSVKRQRGEADAGKQILKFAKSLSGHGNAKVREFAKAQELLARGGEMQKLDNKQRDALVTDVVAWVKGGKVADRLVVAMNIAGTAAQLERTDTAGRLYSEIVDILKDSKDKRLKVIIPRIEGFARRQTVLGNKLDIKGTTVDGKPFKWSDYKGKVVLVDFWATWCGPCLRELPNVRRNYEMYHDKGFEVVGISLDDSQSRLKTFIKESKIPWTNLFAGRDHPMALYYGVQSIPTVFLVDQKGNVVSTDARGPKLGRLLKKLLGPAEKSKPTDDKKK